MKLKIVPIEKKHKRDDFGCGKSLLDDYLRRQARQDVDRRLSACFVLTDEDNVVKGYYTLSANSIGREQFPEDLKKKLPPSYSDLPTILLGRLAVDSSTQGQGMGQLLLMHALNKCFDISKSIGTVAIIVDPIDAAAQKFYSGYQFILLPTSGKMMLPMKTVKELIDG